jgi:hydroxymethylpyrimidine/phosphomethylpyrimidine kinase
MLGTGSVASAVASFLSAQAGVIPRRRIVLDPVVCSSSGASLLAPEGLSVLKEHLLALVGWVTPNTDELALLTGNPVDRSRVPAAAGHLKEMAAGIGNPDLQIVVTGGHLDRPDDFLLTAQGEQIWLPGERVATDSTHGTGCAFSSALLCALISGQDPRQAVAAAKAYVTQALRSAYPVGKGKGPMNHLYALPPL